MKKVLLFVVALCSMVSAMAQQSKIKALSSRWFKNGLQQVEQINRHATDFREKIDSVLISYGVRQIYTYNEDYTVKKTDAIMSYSYFSATHTTEYTYDQEGHIIVMFETTSGISTESHKTEYSYNDNGDLTGYIEYDLKNGSWVPDKKVVGWVNEDESVQQAIRYRMDDEGNWVEYEKVDAFLTNGNLMLELHSTWMLSENAWLENAKAEYEYDANDHVISISTFNKVGGEEEYEWWPDEKDLFSYDNYGSCIRSEEYDYNTVDQYWDLVGQSDYHYDVTAPASDIAGFWVFAEEMEFEINHKVVSVESIASDDTPFSTRFYYSAATGLDEISESSLCLWPNPVHETLSVQAGDLQQVDLFTLDGRHLVMVDSDFDSINVSAVQAGCYLLKATLKDGSVSTLKFLKQ